MASETELLLGLHLPERPWPPDDTGESVVGTDLHQMTIMNLRWGINEVARIHTAPGQPVPWQALSQTIVYGFARPDRSKYKTLPDVFVYPHTVDQNRCSLSVAVDGPPVLVVEVLSESTYDIDLDIDAGKGYSSMHGPECRSISRLTRRAPWPLSTDAAGGWPVAFIVPGSPMARGAGGAVDFPSRSG